MSKKSEYQSKYQELEIIGRGNFGSATLVKSKVDNNLYVAKKVLLGSLNPKETEGAHLEVALLKDLKHPHIVEYIDSYVEDGVLIIIMEYCEEGDLAYFVKKRAQKKEPLDEKLILNWFLQLLLALEFIHRKKILHRDIKSSNIFLRSNGTVKLGDFGISKVLENTNEAAITVVGTPYYMSPEVCENKPYTFKSDVWALGCVLYEMCTLKHAFSADNLLGLVFKIVREKQEPIGAPYTKDLSTTVQKLLTKNSKDRPSIREIFVEPLIQKTIEEFIKTDGQYTTMSKIPIKKTHLHETIKKLRTGELEAPDIKDNGGDLDGTAVSVMTSGNKNQSSNQKQPIQQQQQKIPDSETPQQKMQRLKEEKIRAEEEKMKNAAREAFAVKNQLKDKKAKDLQGSYQTMQSSTTSNATKTTQSNSNQIQVQNLNNSPLKKQSSPEYGIQNLQANNYSQISDITAFSNTNNQVRDMKNDFMDVTNESLSFSKTEESIRTQISNPTIKNQKYQINQQTEKSMYTIKTELEIGSTVNMSRNNMQRKNDYDDRPLPTLANKNPSQPNKMLNQNVIGNQKSQPIDDYDDEDFEEYFSDEEIDDIGRLTMKASKDDIDDVLNLYKEKLVQKGKKELEEIKESNETWGSESTSNSSKTSNDKPIATKKSQLDTLKEKAKAALGTSMFEKAYKFLKQQREAEVPDNEIRAALTEMVGKQNLVHCFTLDQIIFMESI